MNQPKQLKQARDFSNQSKGSQGGWQASAAPTGGFGGATQGGFLSGPPGGFGGAPATTDGFATKQKPNNGGFGGDAS